MNGRTNRGPRASHSHGLHGHPTLHWTALSLAAAGLLLSAPAPAQERDPTRVPAAALPTASASATTTSGPASGPTSDDDTLKAALQHRMVIDGKPYLVERGWLRGVGDKLGEARIERITADEVWLQEGGARRKLPLYPGVQIRPSAPAASATAATGRRRPLPIIEQKDSTR